MVTLYDNKTRSTGAIALQLQKRRLILKSDGEPAIMALKTQVRAAAADVEIIPQESPPGDHKAAGAAENA
eukprot:3243493-Amphidinium_carterae.2